MKLVSVVKDNLIDYQGMGGNVEYGFSAIAGLLMAMVRAGSTIVKDQFIPKSLETTKPVEIPLLAYRLRKEIPAMAQTSTVLNWPKEVICLMKIKLNRQNGPH